MTHAWLPSLPPSSPHPTPHTHPPHPFPFPDASPPHRPYLPTTQAYMERVHAPLLSVPAVQCCVLLAFLASLLACLAALPHLQVGR